MTQEEVNKRLKGLLKKLAKEEIDSCEAIAEFSRLLEEYDRNVSNQNLKMAKDHFIGVVDGLKQIKKVLNNPLPIQLFSGELFEYILPNMPRVKIFIERNKHQEFLIHKIRLGHYLFDCILSVDFKLKNNSFPLNLFQKFRILHQTIKIYSVEILKDERDFVMVNPLQYRALKQCIEYNISLKVR